MSSKAKQKAHNKSQKSTKNAEGARRAKIEKKLLKLTGQARASPC